MWSTTTCTSISRNCGVCEGKSQGNHPWTASATTMTSWSECCTIGLPLPIRKPWWEPTILLQSWMEAVRWMAGLRWVNI
eukprot:12936534-Prorocentrum_lima.AAC.1